MLNAIVSYPVQSKYSIYAVCNVKPRYENLCHWNDNKFRNPNLIWNVQSMNIYSRPSIDLRTFYLFIKTKHQYIINSIPNSYRIMNYLMTMGEILKCCRKNSENFIKRKRWKCIYEFICFYTLMNSYSFETMILYFSLKYQGVWPVI